MITTVGELRRLLSEYPAYLEVTVQVPRGKIRELDALAKKPLTARVVDNTRHSIVSIRIELGETID